MTNVALLGLALVLAPVVISPAQARVAPPRQGEVAKPRKPSAKELAAAKARFRQGKAYYDAGAYGEAAKEYERAYAIAPLPDLLYNVAQAYRMQGDKPKAIAAYERYLAVVTEGAVADEARSHVAALKLKIQVEEAEAAKRKALEEAEAAKRRAAELEEARRRSEAEAVARRKAQQEDTERFRRLAAEEAQRQQKKRAAEQREYLRQKIKAEARGRHLRRAGRAAIVIGVTAVVLSTINVVMMIQKDDEIKQWDDASDRWSTGWADKVKERKMFADMGYSMSIGGGVVMIAGIVMYRVGIHLRNKANEALGPPLTLLPLVAPDRVGLSLGGRF